jgi:hypothetical protein
MRDVPVEEAIKTTMEPNLHFLPSGKLPRNAVGLLDSQRVRDLIKSLKARYDYVFFDSPPIMGVSDASIIASEVDGVMLVVQYRKFPRADVRPRQAPDRKRRWQHRRRGPEQHQHHAGRLLLLLSVVLLASPTQVWSRVRWWLPALVIRRWASRAPYRLRYGDPVIIFLRGILLQG